MPTGPKGQKRSADVIGNAVRVARIATGEEEETFPPVSSGTEGGREPLGGAPMAPRISVTLRTLRR